MVFCLWDRFEISAAVQAGIPYELKFPQIHGGECIIESIDNVCRHQIRHVSISHFTATDLYSNKVSTLIGLSLNVHRGGSLSLDKIENF